MDDDGRNPGFEVTLTGDGMLHFGPYGCFCMEETLLREEMQNEIDFAMRVAEEQ